MPPILMRDLVIVLPGITGSVLQKNGKDLWALSGQALWQYISNLGHSLDALRLPPHDPNTPPDDGVKATGLVPAFHGVFGVGKIDGYTKLVEMIQDNFTFERDNFIQFAYDWRLSSRVNARRLKALIDDRRDLLRLTEPEVGVILVAHSMGGLVSRYYLEVLEGWRDCHAFITFGTPFRGSVNAVDYLANGYKKLFLDLTEVMRTFPSVYELMPRYQMLKVGSAWQRVAEVEKFPPDFKFPRGINQKMAKDALAFHREIDSAVEKNKQDPRYDSNYKWIYPAIGVRQKTLQSAELAVDGLVTAKYDLPNAVNAVYDGGDGTVPRASATPIELSDERRETFFIEQHASLQNNTYALNDIIERLRQMQGTDLIGVASLNGDSGINANALSDINDGYYGGTRTSGEPWIGLQFQDVYFCDEAVRIIAEVSADPNSLGRGLEALVRRVDTGATSPPNSPNSYVFQEVSSRWELTLNGLAPGRYKALVRAIIGGPNAPNPVTAIFEVANLS